MTIRKGRKIIAGNGAASLASVQNPGLVQPDGETIIVNEAGVISANIPDIEIDTTNLITKDNIATSEQAGIVKVDGTTITINEGIISTKDNSFTPVLPLEIKENIIASWKGMSKTDDETGIYSSAAFAVYPSNSANYFILEKKTGVDFGWDPAISANLDQNFKSYIDIPYNIGQTVKIPTGQSEGKNAAVFGYLDEDKKFFPILCLNGLIESGYIYEGSALDTSTTSQLRYKRSLSDGSNYSLSVSSTADTSGVSDLANDNSYCYIQLYSTGEAINSTKLFNYSGTTCRVYKSTTAQSIAVEHLKKINVCRIFPYIYSSSGDTHKGYNSAKPYLINNIARYSIDINLYSYNSASNTLVKDLEDLIKQYDNEFILGDQTIENLLKLKIDNETIKINEEGKLVSAIKAGADVDEMTIIKNAEDKIQAIGLIEPNKEGLLKFWVGTKEEYQSIEGETDPNTFYHITDDEEEIVVPIAGANNLGVVSVDNQSIKVDDNGVLQAILPTNVSTFTNDAGYLTNSEVYTKTEIDSKLSGIETILDNILGA